MQRATDFLRSRANVLRLLILLAILFSGFAINQKPVQAASNGVMTWSVSGNGDFKVELFEVGAAYPSRQTNTGRIYNYWQAGWSNLVWPQNYFVRITNRLTGQAKQTKTLYWSPKRDHVYVEMDWNTDFLVTRLDGMASG